MAVPALMHGIAQEVGVEVNEMKVILVGDETQVDLKPFQTLKEHYDQVEWDYKKLDQHHNPEPYIEIRLKQDAPLLQSYNTSQTPLAYDVKGSERWTYGDRPVDLYQVGSYGLCLSAVALQTCVCYGRRLCEQRCRQGGCSQVFPGWQSHQQEGASLVCPAHRCLLKAFFTS